MEERTLELEVSLLLPGVEDEKDACLDRLEAALQSRKGILRSHLERDNTPVILCVHYDPGLVSIDDVRGMARAAGAGIANRYRHEAIRVEGMDCSDCALVLEHSLSHMDGVMAVGASFAAQTLQVEYDSQSITRRAIERRVLQLGFGIRAEGVRGWYRANRLLLISLLVGLVLGLAWAGERFLGFPRVAWLGLYALAYVIGLRNPVRHAFQALRQRRFDTDLLMVLAALGAAGLGDFAEGALLLLLFGLGHALEKRALDRARNAIRALADLAPKMALVRRDREEHEVPVEELAISDLVVVRPGVRVPVDGEVVAGASVLDQSPVTGESAPSAKGPGAQVYAGSINGDGVIEVRVTRLARDTTLARVQRMVEQAKASKTPTQHSTERFTRFFVPAVLVADLLLILVLPLMGVPFTEALSRGITLLVAASPCALVLGTPSAVLAGVAQAARNGVLVKGGVHLENLGRLRAIAFDKTGTVTQGKAKVTDVIAFDGGSQSDVLALAAAAGARSTHPLSQAFLQKAEELRLDLPEIGRATSLPGRGIQAKLDGKRVWVGNPNLIGDMEFETPPRFSESVSGLEGQGKSAVAVAVEARVVGLIGVADVVRPEAKKVLEALRRLGLRRQVMLTGDNVQAAAEIAGQLGIREYRAGLMPLAKLQLVRELVSEHGTVAMVGDGVNDAPALASATVGIAMGGAGTDVALETADVALMADDLMRLPFAIGLGRATRRVIQQNLWLSLGVAAVLIALGLTGMAGVGLAIFIHEGSTVAVVVNALRLLAFRERNLLSL